MRVRPHRAAAAVNPVRRRWTAWLAGSLWAIWFALLAMLVLIGSGSSRPLLAVLATFAMVTVGALVASRQPANPIGWVFCALGLGFMVGGVSSLYAIRALVDAPGSLPAGVAVAWLSSWVQFPTTMLVLYLLLLFPNGHPPSPRWRGVVWLVTALIAVGTLSAALRPGLLRTGPTGTVLPIDNPLAIEAIGPLLDGLNTVWPVALVALLLAAIGSVILRFRRARGDERQQLKWFAFASCFVPVVIASNFALRPLPEDVRAPIQAAIFGTAMVLFPVVVGLAVLRYRLYDIDVLINRTLVYGALSAVLFGTYVLSVLALSALLRPLTGSGDLAVAGSTLAVVALFAPLRRRIQLEVNRRFYRSRYDAARTIDRFSSRLRDQVDLDALSSELIGVVSETVQPAHASLWLRAARN